MKGFTLIELLVVVLIIGILAAVALPQYQKSVEKARTAEAWSVLASIKTAMEMYRLAHGNDWTEFDASNDKWSLLDISLPMNVSAHANSAKFGMMESKNFTYSLESHKYVRAYRGRYSGGKWEQNDYDLFIDLDGTQWNFSEAGNRLCGEKTTLGTQVCKSLGTKLNRDKYLVK